MCVCLATAQLLEVFDARYVHHVWVLGDDGVPAAVVTPTDVLRVRLTVRLVVAHIS
jgi:hypothetical protein